MSLDSEISPDSSSAHAATPAISRVGLMQAVGSYAVWGVLPLYFWLIRDVDTGEVVAGRILWSLGLLVVLVLMLRRTRAVIEALKSRRALLMLTLSAALISGNWLIYIWAVQTNHVLEGSLGYFLNPLMNVVLGVLLLREKLGRAQKVAVGFAAAGVAVLAAGAGLGILISLSLALTFCFYGFVRKIAPVGALEGLAIETLLLSPPALAYLWWLGQAQPLSFGSDNFTTGVLILSGVVTAVPLLLFAGAARRLPYSTLGLVQYLSPTLQFICAITFFGQSVTPAHLLCFTLIWTGLAIFAADGLWAARRRHLSA